jgi:hypothetical protein
VPPIQIGACLHGETLAPPCFPFKLYHYRSSIYTSPAIDGPMSPCPSWVATSSAGRYAGLTDGSCRHGRRRTESRRHQGAHWLDQAVSVQWESPSPCPLPRGEREFLSPCFADVPSLHRDWFPRAGSFPPCGRESTIIRSRIVLVNLRMVVGTPPSVAATGRFCRHRVRRSSLAHSGGSWAASTLFWRALGP